MGFYGRISNSNKTAFQFDKTFHNRQEMDAGVNSDGVFIGRYVLVEYDEPPISAYYNTRDNNFYSSSDFTLPQTMLTPKTGCVYQDLLHSSGYAIFYYYDGTKYVPANNELSPYAVSYNRDVLVYGRGYDSTAWMKTYDVVTNKYRYVLIAELNTIVPKFHLVYEPPASAPVAPYFDRDTTDVDYYLHAQAEWGHSIRLFNKIYDADGNIVKNNITTVSGAQSDEEISYPSITWTTDENGVQTATRIDNDRDYGDIYYNKAGFDKAQRTVADPSIKNAINYTLDKSGRLYYNSATGNWNSGITKADKMEWYIHLPVLGNAVCEIWDDLFGYNSNGVRYTALAQSRSDNGALVTYNPATVYGAINKVHDILGWVLDTLGNRQVGDYTRDINEANKLYYTTRQTANKEEPVIQSYYFYTFDPQYIAAEQTKNVNPTTGEVTWSFRYQTSDNTYVNGGINDVYYLDTDGYYKHPNLTDWPATMSDGSTVGEQYLTLYMRQNRWRLVQLIMDTEDTIYGLMIKLHRLLGDHSPDVRDENSLQGCINLMNDAIDNISRHLAPHKLLVTDNGGTIISSKIEFPYFNTMHRTVPGGVGDTANQEILDSDGNWRLLTSYRLYTLDLMNNTVHTRYFDAHYTDNKGTQHDGYYGNSCLHAVIETDSMSEAMKKMQHEMADIQYKEQVINTFTASANTGGENYNGATNSTKIENGRDISDVTLTYTLNKGPRQSIKIERINPALGTPLVNTTNINPEYYVTNPVEYAASASGTVHDTNVIEADSLVDATLRWRITVVDERDFSISKDVTMQYMNKVYWGIGGEVTAASLSTLANVTSAITGGGNSLQTSRGKTFTVTAGSGKYIYYIMPNSFGTAKFVVGGFEGGFDDLGTVGFTNGSGYQVTYRVYRSHRPNLGATTVVVS